jgi:hypothetical protein
VSLATLPLLRRRLTHARRAASPPKKVTDTLAGGGGSVAAADQGESWGGDLEKNPADLVEGATGGWNATLAMMRQNRADFAITVHGPSKELLDASNKAKAEAKAINDTVPDSSIAQVGYNIANLAASMFSSGKQAVAAAGAGAAVGAAAGAVGGLPGAIGGAVSGGAAGLAGGYLSDSYVTNSGQIMGDLREAGVDPSLAKGFGMAGGAVMAGLDLFGIGFAARPFVRAAERKLVQKEVSDALTKSALREGVKDYLVGLTGETGAETAQQIVQDVTTDLAKTADGGDYQTIFNDPKRRREVINNAVQTAIATAEGMAVLGVPGLAVNLSRKTPSGENAEQAMPTLDALQQEFGPELSEVTPKGPKPSDDALGRNPVPQKPQPGRQYNVADAIAELGMSPEEAQSFVTTGKDSRVLEQHGFTGTLTPDDIDSPIGNDTIIKGKELLAGALEDEPRRFTDYQSLKEKIGGAENATGNPNAKNPRSSASGRFQFTDGTWTALGGDLAKKNDPDEQERVMDKLIAQNHAALYRAGKQTTDGNMYLAHFLGAQGAIDALNDPNGKVSAKVQAANPFTQGWTNGQLAAWANRKMGGKPGVWTSNPNTAADKAWAEKDVAPTARR